MTDNAEAILIGHEQGERAQSALLRNHCLHAMLYLLNDSQAVIYCKAMAMHCAGHTPRGSEPGNTFGITPVCPDGLTLEVMQRSVQG